MSSGFSATERSSGRDSRQNNELSFMYSYFPSSWVEELFYSISQEYEDWPTSPLPEEFFPELAARAETMAEEGFEKTDGVLAFPTLPDELNDALEEVLYDLSSYSEELSDREAFLLQWAELLREASGGESEEDGETYELLLQFEEEDIAQIQKLLVRKGLEEDEDLDAALSRYIYQLLGKALVREAGPYLLAWNGEEEMARVGERLQRTD